MATRPTLSTAGAPSCIKYHVYSVKYKRHNDDQRLPGHLSPWTIMKNWWKHQDMGVSFNGGTQNGCFVVENPNLKWMILGLPLWLVGNLHMMRLCVKRGHSAFPTSRPFNENDDDCAVNMRYTAVYPMLGQEKIWRCPEMGAPRKIISILHGFSHTIQRSRGTPMTSKKFVGNFFMASDRHIGSWVSQSMF